jgi:hypothetical protein
MAGTGGTLRAQSRQAAAPPRRRSLWHFAGSWAPSLGRSTIRLSSTVLVVAFRVKISR